MIKFGESCCYYYTTQRVKRQSLVRQALWAYLAERLAPTCGIRLSRDFKFLHIRHSGNERPQYPVDGLGCLEHYCDIWVKNDHQLVLTDLISKTVRLGFAVIKTVLVSHIVRVNRSGFSQFGVLHSLYYTTQRVKRQRLVTSPPARWLSSAGCLSGKYDTETLT
jgi:acid stress-induced BolA-like protein IbaG/YrbA